MKAGKIRKYILFALPLAAGVCGLWAVGRERFADALYHALQMYALDFDGEPDNLLVELARWTAPLVTASWIVAAFASLRRWWRCRMRYLRGGSIAVCGESEEKTELLRQLGRRGIDGGERCVRAQRYILLGGEEENFAFCRENREALRGHMVYLRCASARAQAARGADRKLFSPEENAARLFWKQSGLSRDFGRAEGRLRIVLIGFGRLGEELLYWGLQDNLFDPDQTIEYHVFGDGRRFAALHGSLEGLSDPVLFHEEPWYESLPLLESADRILLCTPDAAGDARDVLFAVPEKTLDVFAEAESADDFLEERERLRFFPWRREALRPEIILDETLLRRAKRINLRYAVLYGGAADTPEELESRWSALGAFTRYSNISSADYHEIRLQMLADRGFAPDPETLPAGELERMSELEHIRWCRYHLLNNWRYGLPENGARKDAAKRIHRDLVPYADLTEEEKEKDRENIRVLLAMPE